MSSPVEKMTPADQKAVDAGYKMARDLLSDCNKLEHDRAAMSAEVVRLQTMSTHVLACLVFSAFKQAQKLGKSISLLDVEDSVRHNLRLEIQNAAENFDAGTTTKFSDGSEGEH